MTKNQNGNNLLKLANKYENEEEIDIMFNKHKTNSICKKKSYYKEFTNTQIDENKKILRDYENNKLIKEQNHFCLDENELYKENFDDDDLKDNCKINKENIYSEDFIFEGEKGGKYFDSIHEQTIKNNFYCSYSDFFDKIYTKNKEFIKHKELRINNPKKIFENEFKNSDSDHITTFNEGKSNKKSKYHSLSCAGCFNQLDNYCILIEHFNNVFIAFNLENVYFDYNIILNTDDLMAYIDNNMQKLDVNLYDILNNTLNQEQSEIKDYDIPKNANSKVKLSLKQIESLGLDHENKKFKQYISTKCSECHLIVSFFDSLKNRYLVFNSI